MMQTYLHMRAALVFWIHSACIFASCTLIGGFMELQIIKLAAVFFIIVLLIFFRRALYQAVLAGIIATGVLYGIKPIQMGGLILNVISSWSAMSILVVLYLITFLQRILEKRYQIKLAQQDLNGLFNNRRVNASVAPLFIGLLPSAAAMILCGDIVKESTDGYLDRKEQGFVANWFRHIPESTLPTYSGVLLMSNLANVDIASFMVGMIFPVVVMYALGYFLYLRKLPKDTGIPPGKNKWQDFLGLIKHLWSLLLIILLILVFGISVVESVGIVIVIALFVYRFRWSEIRTMFRKAFEKRMIGNTFLILVFKAFIDYTDVIHTLPEFFSQFPIPLFMVFSLLFFFGGIVTGTSGIIALGTAMAFSAILGAGMPLMVLLMCMCHAASQISPTHVCLAVITEYFGITIGELVRKTLPVTLIFMVIIIGYYQLLLKLVS